jgi:hypothetical protein
MSEETTEYLLEVTRKALDSANARIEALLEHKRGQDDKLIALQAKLERLEFEAGKPMQPGWGEPTVDME